MLSEINFAELYDGCALAPELDGFLADRGFRRVATSCFHHPTWGDALYLRTALGQAAEGREQDSGTPV